MNTPAPSLKFLSRALAAPLAALVLASCGGGGGGGGTGSTPIESGGPQSVAITETNAKPVAANALDAAQNTSATRGANGVPVGVQVDAAAANNFQFIAEAARFAATSFAAAQLPVGISVNQTVQCTLGGTMNISGNVANANALSQGDSLRITTANCGLAAGSITMVMSGQMQITIASGTIGTSLPFHVVMQTTATNLSVASGGVTVVANGDSRLDWNATSATFQTLTASGTQLSNVTTVSGASHTTTMRNYSQTVTINGSTVIGSLQATIETSSSRIAGTPVQYTISTPTPVTWNATTRVPSAGVVKVVGAANSQLVLTVNGDGTATIQLDANGDGTFEKTITTTIAELNGLL